MNTRNAARTVIINEEGLVALIEAKGGIYYKIPGGGIEDGETAEQAAKREAMEETGCDIQIIQKIGESEFTDDSIDQGQTINHSICYLARKVGEQKDTSFDEWEQSNKMCLKWVTFDKAIELFSKFKDPEPIHQKINDRDYEFILKAQEILNTK